MKNNNNKTFSTATINNNNNKYKNINKQMLKIILIQIYLQALQVG